MKFWCNKAIFNTLYEHLNEFVDGCTYTLAYNKDFRFDFNIESIPDNHDVDEFGTGNLLCNVRLSPDSEVTDYDTLIITGNITIPYKCDGELVHPHYKQLKSNLDIIDQAIERVYVYPNTCADSDDYNIFVGAKDLNLTKDTPVQMDNELAKSFYDDSELLFDIRKFDQLFFNRISELYPNLIISRKDSKMWISIPYNRELSWSDITHTKFTLIIQLYTRAKQTT